MTKKEKIISAELASRFGEGLYELTQDVDNPHPDRRSNYEFWLKAAWSKGTRFIVRFDEWALATELDLPEMQKMSIAPAPNEIRHARLHQRTFGTIVHTDEGNPRIEGEGDEGDKEMLRVAAVLPYLERVKISNLQDACDLYDLESDALFPTLAYLLKRNKIQLADIIEAGILNQEDRLWVAAGLQEDDNDKEHEE